jgi:hypothetical protein
MFSKYHMAVTLSVWAGYHYRTLQKISHHFFIFFYSNDRSGNIAGQKQQFWTTDGQILGQEELNDTCRKTMYMGMMDSGSTVIPYTESTSFIT